MKSIPNIITLLNLFLGCMAVVFIMNGNAETGAMMIIVCAILDFLDGAAARLFNAYSDVGKQLDSLADLISFGLAPATILFHYLSNALQSINPEANLFVLPSLAFFVTIFSALRLARFNTDEEAKDYFTGLPTPANALLIASVPLTLAIAPQESFSYAMLNTLQNILWPNIMLITVLSFLLIAPVKMFSLKVKSLTWKDNRIRIIYLAGCIILLITFGWAAMPMFLVFYILLSLLWPVILPMNSEGRQEAGRKI